jgi:hypothetical protein
VASGQRPGRRKGDYVRSVANTNTPPPTSDAAEPEEQPQAEAESGVKMEIKTGYY